LIEQASPHAAQHERNRLAAKLACPRADDPTVLFSERIGDHQLPNRLPALPIDLVALLDPVEEETSRILVDGTRI
jgi:hypothetical protein